MGDNIYIKNREDREIDIATIINTVRNNIWSISFIVLITLAGTAIYIYEAREIYSSNVIIAIDSSKQNRIGAILPDSIYSKRDEDGLDIAKVTIKSRKFIETIIDRVDVDRELFVQKNFRSVEVDSFSDIKVEIDYKDIAGENLYGKLFEIIPISNSKFILKVNGGEQYGAIHSYGERIDRRLFSIKVIKLSEREPLEDAIESKILNLLHINIDIDSPINHLMAKYSFRFFDRVAQIDRVRDGITIYELSNRILKIEYQDTTPMRTRDVIDEVANRYIEYTMESRDSELEQTLEFLDRQILSIRRELNSEGDRLKKYQQKSGSVIMGISGDILKNLEKSREQVNSISLQIREVDRFIRAIKRDEINSLLLSNVGIDTSSIQYLIDRYIRDRDEINSLMLQQNSIDKSVTSNSQIVQMVSNLRDSELHLQELKTKFTDRHPDVIEIKSKIEYLRDRIDTELMRYLYLRLIVINYL
ncbi:MAG: hypothetical protein GXO06_00630, partial [Epsilonproteobacteria bacterium]|nr:hypothetical protein [Campylobacterota bacterium]